MSFYSLSNVPDSNRVAKGLLRVLLFNLKNSCEIWWFLWIILKSCEEIEIAGRVFQKNTLYVFLDLIELNKLSAS